MILAMYADIPWHTFTMISGCMLSKHKAGTPADGFQDLAESLALIA